MLFKRIKRIFLCGIAAVLLSVNAYGKEVQLTDYRYENGNLGMNGYSFFDCHINYYSWFTQDVLNSKSRSNGSVVLKPDGTEVCPQGKYRLRIEYEYDEKSRSGWRRTVFPQYYDKFVGENDFERDGGSGFANVVVFDGEGNVINETYTNHRYNFFFDDDIYFTGFIEYDAENYEQRYIVYGFVNTKTGKEVSIGDDYYERDSFGNFNWGIASEAYVSEDGRYFKFAGVIPTVKPFTGYYTREGNKISDPGCEFKRVVFPQKEMGYRFDEDRSMIMTNFTDESYSIKGREIGGRRYYALFKEVGEGESVESGENPSAWAASEIEELKAKGLLYNNSLCRFTESITRQEFCILAVEAYLKGINEDIDDFIKENDIQIAEYRFSDTQNIYVGLAEYLGIVKGTSEKEFSPYNEITRQEAAVMLKNLCDLLGIESEGGGEFVDRGYFADWAEDSIAFISGVKTPEGVAVMGGTEEGKFSPWYRYSREQSYCTLNRILSCAESK